MEVFWNTLIKPLFAALKPRCIVEVGCEDGKNTKHLIDYCATHVAELHVIDPKPLLDATLLQRCFPSPPAPLPQGERGEGNDFSFTLHAKKSLEVLPGLPRTDVVLLDGDHNWYTVRHELQGIEELGERTGCRPLVLLHDVCWPYGRRDMYYEPNTIPANSRHPFARQAMTPGQNGLSTGAGWNSEICNARHEGGPRNGVLTAIEDFLDDTRNAYQFRLIPAFHGLGILCPASLLEANRDLAAFLESVDRQVVDGGLLASMEQERVRLLDQAMRGQKHPQAAHADVDLLEWTIAAVSQSSRWRIGSAIVNGARSLVGLKRQAQVTDMLRDIVSTRKQQAAIIDEQAARVAQDSGAAAVISTAFHQLFYNEPRTWRQTTWLGVPVWKCTFDLWIYQEIIHETRPDLIIETGTSFGGSALFLAGVCDQLGRGEILTIDIEARPDRPQHPRIQYLTGDSAAADIVAHAAQRAAAAQRVMVILDSDHRCEHVLAELNAYAGLVTKSCYLIVEDTNVNGHPVFAEHGAGPMEALDLFLAENSDFAIDKGREKYFLTFNPRGFLRRN